MWDFRMHPPRGMFLTVNPLYTPGRTSQGGGDVDASEKWLGSVWSHRGSRVIVGRLRAVEGANATLAVVGLGPAVPEGARELPPDDGGSPMLQVPLLELLGRWKRLGRIRPVPG
jgi:hypothetical protein